MSLDSCLETIPCFVNLLIGEILMVIGILAALRFLIGWWR